MFSIIIILFINYLLSQETEIEINKGTIYVPMFRHDYKILVKMEMGKCIRFQNEYS